MRTRLSSIFEGAVDITVLLTAQKLTARSTAKGTQEVRNVRVANRMFTCARRASRPEARRKEA